MKVFCELKKILKWGSCEWSGRHEKMVFRAADTHRPTPFSGSEGGHSLIRITTCSPVNFFQDPNIKTKYNH